MREIKFRGKLVEDSKSFRTYKKGTIVTGGYCSSGDKHFIVAHFNVFEVEPDSVSQFTGLHDKNGTEIYEGDILSDYTETDEGVVKSFQQVYWDGEKGAWMLDESYHQNKSEGSLLSKNLEQFEYEISGNIYKNPELINS